MRVLLCPDSFKGCLDAPAVARAMREGVSRAGAHKIDECPVSDGGEGFTQAIASALDAPLKAEVTIDALHNAFDAPYVLYGKEFKRNALFTVADIVGPSRVPRLRRNPAKLRTAGIGMMIRSLAEPEGILVLDRAVRLIIGLGGSCTVDGGVDMAYILGWEFLDKRGELCLGDWDRKLSKIVSIRRVNTPRPLEWMKVVAAHDVMNPLTGPNGTARVFGPQKGATPGQVERLDKGLAHLRRVCIEEGLTDEADHPGDGAAGGLGFGLRVFAGARLTPGARVVIDATGLRDRIAGADLVITGEGRLDHQSASGKIAWAVGSLAGELGVPCVCVAGSFGDGWEGASEVFARSVRATPEGMGLEEGVRRAGELIAEAVSGLPELSPGG